MSYSATYDSTEGIAIVGMAGRFPGARNVGELWQNLLAGRETIDRFTADELGPAHPEDMEARSDPNYVRARGILADVDMFDARFFGFSPKEAAVLDPQQRLFMETSWEALEHAGYDPKTFAGSIGVYAGATSNSYFLNNLLSRRDVTDLVGLLTTQMANQNHYVATRVAYKLDLKGPALNIQTACSTSLVAVCTAVQSLLTYQCDMALAGGVSVQIPQKRGYLYQEGSILAPDGHCRAFDRDASGTVFSNGLGIVVLRRLRDAIADGDTIYAVIKGAALNNDGSSKVSFTAPSVDGHAQVIAMAQALGGIDPATISYIEAHGTGTALGDPVEIAGLTQAFRAGGATANGYCAIGSLKTNIGHLDAAAGVAGLIKTSLALHHKVLPASLNYHSPNPKLDIENTPFFVNAALRDWPSGATARRAGVSSFGVGGTNAHVVLEEAPPREHADIAGRKEQLLLISARDDDALGRASDQLKNHLERDDATSLADIAYTLQTGRRAFGHRRALVCRGREDAVALLQSADPKRVFQSSCDASDISVGFMFPGQGAQYVNMGRTLYESEPVFREEIDACAAVLRPFLGVDLRHVLYPDAGSSPLAQEQLTQTAITQPALFAVEYALAQLWLSWGVTPKALIGHSVGEYVAACVGGTFRRDDALALLAQRARLMQAMPSGAMLAVRASATKLAEDLGPRTSIAAINAPNLTVVSGDHEAIAQLAAALGAKGVACRLLPTSHAFHSPMMEPVVAQFVELVERTPRQRPTLHWMSSLTGTVITDAEATDPVYWARQLREPVRFMDGVGRLFDPRLALVEVGPGQALTSLARQHGERKSEQLIVTSLHPGQEFSADLEYLLAAAGQLWTRGLTLDWSRVHGGAPRQRVALPTYPFSRQRCWVDPAPRSVTALPTAGAETIVASAEISETNRPADPAPVASPSQPQEPTVAQMTEDRVSRLTTRLQGLFAELSGIDAGALIPTAGFLELGLDSLFLTQASNAIQKQFGAKIPIRVMLEDGSTLAALAARLDALIPPDTQPVAAAVPAPVAPAPVAPAVMNTPSALPAVTMHAVPGANAAGAPPAALANVFAQQLAIISRQLEMLGAGTIPISATPPAVQQSPVAAPAAAATIASASPAVVTPSVPAVQTASAPVAAFGPYRPPAKGPTGGLTALQERNLEDFIERYNRRTAGSKRATAANRAHLADPRSVAGFRLVWKEMVYPIVSVRSAGSKIWDIDGNEYVDLTNGFGMTFFGHNPDFIRDAVKAQLDSGIEIGPQTPLAGEVASMVCDMVGMERAAFCCTGSEAVTAAIRVARTVTGRDKIIMFTGAYHGIFDEVLVRPTKSGNEIRATPIAPGIPTAMADNILALEYGTPETLRTIKSMGSQIAAVLVEPVQSRRPELQPREFLRELRKITSDSGAALIFDEVVTGFRVHPGGAQALFGVRADIATYGKVIGGGLPIGIVAGSAKYMDALDGGTWRYGDDSVPEVGVTFFAGTFVRHPLALAAARAVLLHLKEHGSELQRRLNLRTTKFVEALRKAAEAAGAPAQINHFSSWFCINFPPNVPLSGIFFASMRSKGVHIWEGRPCFLTLAHTDADLELVINAFETTIAEMQLATFLPERSVDAGQVAPPPGARKGRDAAGNAGWFLPDPSRPGKYLQVKDPVSDHV
ncbi:MAG: aminotransferase class III-fold pyridoxal phosphate-dependent enzyme [Burkholderiaceae bacterium]